MASTIGRSCSSATGTGFDLVQSPSDRGFGSNGTENRVKERGRRGLRCGRRVWCCRDCYGASFRRDSKAFTLQTLAAQQPEERRGEALAQSSGFSLHAGVAAAAPERTKLERLCPYVNRPALSEQRFSLTPQGDIRYALKTPYRDGTTHVVFEPLDFLARQVRPVTQPTGEPDTISWCIRPAPCAARAHRAGAARQDSPARGSAAQRCSARIGRNDLGAAPQARHPIQSPVIAQIGAAQSDAQS